jgi:ribosome-associated protein
MTSSDLVITPQVRIPLAEVTYRFARSRGPGGQHVNKVETAVELLFDVAQSPSLSDDQRRRVLSKLNNQIDADGVLHLVSHSARSQLRNREAVTERFVAVLAAALHVPKKRRPTTPSAASKEKRLQSKKQHGRIKQLRRQAPDE